MRRGTFRAKVDARGHGCVFIDDKDISHLVSEFVVKSDVRSVTTVSLRLIGVDLDLEVEGELDVKTQGAPSVGELGETSR